MSQWYDIYSGAGNGTDVGPQTDGTNILAPTSTIPVPNDAAGGAPAQYTTQVLDLFKFGVGALADYSKTQQLFDYKKFEATNGGLYQQGRSAAMPAAANGGNSGLLLMGVAAVVLFAVLTHKG